MPRSSAQHAEASAAHHTPSPWRPRIKKPPERGSPRGAEDSHVFPGAIGCSVLSLSRVAFAVGETVCWRAVCRTQTVTGSRDVCRMAVERFRCEASRRLPCRRASRPVRGEHPCYARRTPIGSCANLLMCFAVAGWRGVGPTYRPLPTSQTVLVRRGEYENRSNGSRAILPCFFRAETLLALTKTPISIGTRSSNVALRSL